MLATIIFSLSLSSQSRALSDFDPTRSGAQVPTFNQVKACGPYVIILNEESGKVYLYAVNFGTGASKAIEMTDENDGKILKNSLVALSEVLDWNCYSVGTSYYAVLVWKSSGDTTNNYNITLVDVIASKKVTKEVDVGGNTYSAEVLVANGYVDVWFYDADCKAYEWELSASASVSEGKFPTYKEWSCTEFPPDATDEAGALKVSSDKISEVVFGGSHPVLSLGVGADAPWCAYGSLYGGALALVHGTPLSVLIYGNGVARSVGSDVDVDSLYPGRAAWDVSEETVTLNVDMLVISTSTQVVDTVTTTTITPIYVSITYSSSGGAELKNVYTQSLTEITDVRTIEWGYASSPLAFYAYTTTVVESATTVTLYSYSVADAPQLGVVSPSVEVQATEEQQTEEQQTAEQQVAEEQEATQQVAEEQQTEEQEAVQQTTEQQTEEQQETQTAETATETTTTKTLSTQSPSSGIPFSALAFGLGWAALLRRRSRRS